MERKRLLFGIMVSLLALLSVIFGFISYEVGLTVTLALLFVFLFFKIEFYKLLESLHI